MLTIVVVIIVLLRSAVGRRKQSSKEEREDDGKQGERQHGPFEELVLEQTPGGLNEMCIKHLEGKGCFQVYRECLDAVHGRLTNTK